MKTQHRRPIQSRLCCIQIREDHTTITVVTGGHGGVMINFSSVAAYTMPQTDEWTQVFEAWNEPDFYDRLLALVWPMPCPRSL